MHMVKKLRLANGNLRHRCFKWKRGNWIGKVPTQSFCVLIQRKPCSNNYTVLRCRFIFDSLYKWKYVCSLVLIEGMDLIQPPDIFRKRSVTNLANKYM